MQQTYKPNQSWKTCICRGKTVHAPPQWLNWDLGKGEADYITSRYRCQTKSHNVKTALHFLEAEHLAGNWILTYCQSLKFIITSLTSKIASLLSCGGEPTILTRSIAPLNMCSMHEGSISTVNKSEKVFKYHICTVGFCGRLPSGLVFSTEWLQMRTWCALCCCLRGCGCRNSPASGWFDRLTPCWQDHWR